MGEPLPLGTLLLCSTDINLCLGVAFGIQRQQIGSIPCFLGREDRPAMLGVRGEFLLTTLGMGGPDDDLRSNPLA